MIREGRPEDARPLAELVGRAHLHAVGRPADEGVDELEELWAARLGGGARVWVWDQNDVVSGVVALAGRDVVSLCVDPTAQGAGVGAALHELVLTELGEGEARLMAPAESDQSRVFLGERGWREEPEGSGTYVR
ncbi:GNAT family N-acetyltransferase [Conexibacter sp. SYSU D00693]|uniref:GNAT family N-acetyltransferase n=1 Tax=Conexibacter sp. SYSU D00693 TaxID=2812560 RepID=UPI00196A6C98|nr:GNAT family N-acetyltransferase [Conexibacter sp. SYSU D00693]